MTVASTAEPQVKNKSIISIPPSELRDFKGGNTRRKRVQNSFAELVESVRISGIIQSPVARSSDDGGYELVVGHNRRDAAIEVGLETIDVEVRQLTDREALAMHLDENLVREDLSFVDQVEAAKRWVSFFQGDRESAAKRMSWSLKQLNERMELANCSDSVMDALDSGEIAAGHALILSTMPEKLQNGSLQTVINEKLTVADLRKRASKVRIPLAVAKFDKADCQGCKHNSELQAGLFGTDSNADATCSNATCFKQKTQAHLADKYKSLEEKFGKVLFVTESMSSDRNTVAAENVGDNQFNSGCVGCADRAALLDDRPGKEGTVFESQCLNVDCFNSCAATFKQEQKQVQTKEEAKVNSSESQVSATETGSSTKTAKETTAKKQPEKAVAYQPSNVVIEKHKAEIVDFGRDYFSAHEGFRLAMAIASIEHTVTGIKGDVLPERIKALASKPKQELFQLLSSTLTDAIAKGSMFGSYDPFSVFSSGIKGVDAKEKAIQAWTPTEKGLKTYTIEGIKHLCADSGFDKAINADNDKAFSKLSGKGKGDFVKGVIKADFDWSSFAPKAFSDLL